jgi:hypothetical protein
MTRMRVVGRLRFVDQNRLNGGFLYGRMDRHMWTIEGKVASIDSALNHSGGVDVAELQQDYEMLARHAVEGRVDLVIDDQPRYLRVTAKGRSRAEAEWLDGTPDSHAARPSSLVSEGRMRVVAHLKFKTAVGASRAIARLDDDLRRCGPWASAPAITADRWTTDAGTATLDVECPLHEQGKWDSLFDCLRGLAAKAVAGQVDVARDGSATFTRFPAPDGGRFRIVIPVVRVQGFGQAPEGRS